MKNILFAASECVPFIKTGGLADVCGALPSYINKDEFDVRVILPYYTCIPAKFRDNFKYITHFYMDYGINGNSVHVGIMEYEYNGIKFFNSEGFKLDDDIEDQIEDIILRDIDVNSHITGDKLGRCLDADDDAADRYAVFLVLLLSSRTNERFTRRRSNSVAKSRHSLYKNTKYGRSIGCSQKEHRIGHR